MDLYNPEAENYVLGCLIDDYRCHDALFGYLKADDFKGEKQQIVFKCLERLKTAKVAIDAIVVIDDLRQSGSLETVGGSQFIASIMDNVVASNAKYWADKVKDLSKRRKIVRMCHETLDMARQESEDINSMMAKVDETFMSLDDSTGYDYQHVREIVPSVVDDIFEDMQRHGKVKGITTGIPKLDWIIGGFQDDDYWVIGARPSVGKTASALQLIINAASNNARPGIFSAEMNKKALVRRMISNMAAVDGNAIRQGMVPTNKAIDITDAAQLLNTRNIIINDTPNINLMKLEASARKMVRKEGVNIIFIDYIGLIDYTPPNKMMKRNEIIGAISRRLKGLARELKIPIIVLAQLNRDAENAVPTKANLKESGDIEQDADGIILLHNKETKTSNESEVEMLFIIDKQRNGPQGIVDITHKKAFGRMIESEYTGNG